MGLSARAIVLAGIMLAANGVAVHCLAADDSLDEGLILVEEGDEERATGEDAIVVEEGDADDTIVVEDDAEEAIVVEDDAEDAIVVEDDAEDAIVVEDDAIVVEDDAEDAIVVDDDAEAEVIEIEHGDEPEAIVVDEHESGTARTAEAGDSGKQPTQSRASGIQARADKLRLEYSPLPGSDESVDAVGYGNAEFSLAWNGTAQWEARLAGRVDAYLQTGEPQADDAELDYGESYLRYRADDLRVTVGTQTVIWGRIDEIPPTDRLSVQDLSRFFLDDLQDRRRARPMVRVEGFADKNKLELLWTPTFRGAESPEEDSIWYPIDRRRGEVLGLASDPLLRQVVRGALIDDDAPDSDNGFGLRFSRTESALDYALTAQQGRQSTPYFRYDLPRNTLEARYPSAWSLGGDIGMEAAGAIWRVEAAWISDVPVTREDYRYAEVEGVNWAAGVEFFPGDGDARVNLQFAASNLYDTTDAIDRTDLYNVNGSVEVPFAQDRWRAKLRFFTGLDERDVYVNPEIVFLGWQPHSLYLELHYFDGEDGTLGGFHDDHSIVSVGWRAEF